ncbi:MAG: transferase hexapeptide repeat family protein [Lautropia sp.]|nr:transferase hexapeptide repeat family protein [Lautropia sp.]
MGGIYAYGDLVPVVDPSAYVHPCAVLLGDVVIGAGCYVAPGAVLRGDFGRIELKAGANIQDNCVAHSFPGQDVIVSEDGHVGHGAVLHGCLIGRNVMVGMNAVVMDEAVIGENSIVGAMAFVKAGMQVPAASLVLGSPARVIRSLTDQEIAWKTKGTGVYQQLAASAAGLIRPVTPLSAPEPDRQRLHGPEHIPLRRLKEPG